MTEIGAILYLGLLSLAFVYEDEITNSSGTVKELYGLGHILAIILMIIGIIGNGIITVWKL